MTAERSSSEQHESCCLFGAEALLSRLQDVAKEIDGVRKAEDIECVHDMRVATRRTRSALALFGDCLPGKSSKKWNKQMRRVTRALGDARDTDVQMAFLQEFLNGLTELRYRPGVQRLLLRLRQKRERAQPKIIAAMDQLELSGVLEEMGVTLRRMRIHSRMNHVVDNTPYVYQQAYLAVSLRLENMLAHEACVTQPERLEELHAMRIASKRLRYTMEIFEPLYHGDLKEPLKTVRKVQTMLGDIHDCDVWVGYLPQFLEEERIRTVEYYGHARPLNRLKTGLLHLQQDRQKRREELHGEFARFWQELQDQDFWDGLLEKLSQPLPEPLEEDNLLIEVQGNEGRAVNEGSSNW